MIVTVLVTGANGFVGKALCQYLCEKGYRVNGAVRNMNKVKELPEGVNGVVIGNVDAQTDWRSVLKGVQCVVHTAALAHQLGIQDEIKANEFVDTNVRGTEKLVSDIKQFESVKKLIFISTIGVLASESEDVVTDKMKPNPKSNYSNSKLEAEEVIRNSLNSSGIDWVVLRPVLVYGEGNSGNMGRLVRLIRTGLPLPLKSIKNKRSFLYVGNFVEVIERSIVSNSVVRNTYIVSDQDDVSTPELIKCIADVLNKKVLLISVPTLLLKILAFFGDIISKIFGRSIGLDSYSLNKLGASLVVNSSQLYKDLDYSPKYTLKEGVRNTLIGSQDK